MITTTITIHCCDQFPNPKNTEEKAHNEQTTAALICLKSDISQLIEHYGLCEYDPISTNHLVFATNSSDIFIPATTITLGQH